MKSIYLLILLVSMFLPLAALAQPTATLMIGNQQITGRQLDAETWEFIINGEPFLLLKKNVVADLAKKIELLENDKTLSEKIIAAKDTLIRNFENYQQQADRHIEIQQKLIATADSLYSGYKSLYSDLKKITGLNTFSLTAGVGLIDPPGASWRPVGSLGVGINNYLAQFQFGKEYKGLVVGVRWPVF
jgi:hypothetical protein